MGQSLTHLKEGPDDCPICEGPCKEPLERGHYRIGDPPEKHPSNRKEGDDEPAPRKRPKGKRRPAEDRARHLAEDR